MKRNSSYSLIAALFVALAAITSHAGEKHRLIILADMGNEPDEMQQMIHMITCSNEFDIEGLIAVTGTGQSPPGCSS